MDLQKICLCSLACSIYLYAQDINRLEDVVVTATKTQNSVKNLTTSVQVIGPEEIENSGASNLTEILNSTAGIYIRPSGTTYSIRGMQHSDTLILIDGRRVNGEFSKTFELERISAGMIERIEILKGASSLLYGSDAMGGVINIITKKSQNTLKGSLQIIGAEDKKAVDFFVSNKVGKTSFSLYSNYLDRQSYNKDKTTKIKIMQSGTAKSPSTLPNKGSFGKLASALNDSYTIENDYIDNLTVKTIGGKLGYEFSDSFDAYIDFSYMSEDKDGLYISTSYPTNYASPNGSIMAKNVPAHQYNENERTTFSTGLNYRFSEDMDIKYNIAYSKYEKDRKSYTPLYSQLGYSSLQESAFSVNKSTIKHLDNELQFTHTLNESNRYILGAEYRINDTKSTAFNVDDRTYSSFFAQHEYNILEDLKLIYGARYDKTSEDESEVSYSFGGVYDLSDILSLKANYSEGFRSPDDRELYVDQTTPTGKKKLGATVVDVANGKTSSYELKSETSSTIELGFLVDLDIMNLELVAFKTDIDDRITDVSYGSYNTFENISDSEIKGIESSLSFNPIDSFFVDMTYSIIDAKNKDDDIDLTQIPEKTVGLVLSYFPTENTNIKTITKYIGTQYTTDYEKLGGFTITNLKFSMTNIGENTDFFAGVDNVFDKKTNENLGIIPQSYLYAGIKYNF